MTIDPPSPYTALDNTPPTVPAERLVTSGSLQLVVCCPRCDERHRHLGLGLRRSPCGCWYVISPPTGPADSTRRLTAA